MIDSVLNLLFGCYHRNLTRPFTPLSQAGIPHGDCYVVCLDCAKQFTYDMKEMRIGKPIHGSHDACVVGPETPMSRKTKLKYALWVSVPVALVAGFVLKSKVSRSSDKVGAAGEPKSRRNQSNRFEGSGQAE